MTTIRQAHHRKYVSISNSLAQNNALSLKARGLMLYLLSLPNDWEVRVTHLIKTLGEGRNSILEILKELKVAGYIHSGKSGYQGKTQYFVFEEHMSQDGFKKYLQSIGFLNSLKSKRFTKHPPIQSTNRRDTKDEPNRTKEPTGSDRDGSPSLSEEKGSGIASLEEIEMISDHARDRSEGKILLKHSDIRAWKRKYGLERTICAVDLAIEDMKSGTLLTNPAGWITNALKKGY